MSNYAPVKIVHNEQEVDEVTVCAGGWLILTAGGGDDCDVVEVAESLCGGCPGTPKCGENKKNCDALYVWDPGDPSPFYGEVKWGDLNENYYFRIRRDVYPLDVSLECSREQYGAGVPALCDTPTLQSKTITVHIIGPTDLVDVTASKHQSVTGTVDAAAIFRKATEDVFLLDQDGVAFPNPDKDFNCCKGFELSGSVETYIYGTGVIDSDADLQATWNASPVTNARFVNDGNLRWCAGEYDENIIGCAWTGNQKFVIELYAGLSELAALAAHEYGHSHGNLGHYNSDVSNFMYWLRDKTYGSDGYVLADQCASLP